MTEAKTETRRGRGCAVSGSGEFRYLSTVLRANPNLSAIPPGRITPSLQFVDLFHFSTS